MLGSHPWKRRRTSPFACLLVVTLGILGWGCLLPAVAGQSLREETSIGESGYKKILSAIQRDLDRGGGHVIDGDDDRVMFTWIVSATRGRSFRRMNACFATRHGRIRSGCRVTWVDPTPRTYVHAFGFIWALLGIYHLSIPPYKGVRNRSFKIEKICNIKYTVYMIDFKIENWPPPSLLDQAQKSVLCGHIQSTT